MTTKTKHRYQQVIDIRQITAGQLQEAMDITPEAYQEAVFDTGMKLLENYFGESLSDAAIQRLHNRLLQNSKGMYWPWYINQREQWQDDFWRVYRPLFAHVAAVEGHDYASAMLQKDWHDDNRSFTNDTVIHERLRQFILSQLK